MMTTSPGAGAFAVSGTAYDDFMGRYSRSLATVFADAADVAAGHVVLDVGCGPGALTSELVDRVGAGAVSACDPSPSFVDAFKRRHPDVDVRAGAAEAIPYGDAEFDRVLAQLVLHFVAEPTRAVEEFRRVAAPGAMVAACVWDFDQGMQMLRHFWDAALSVDRDAPDEARTLRFGGPGEIAAMFEGAGFTDVRESTLQVASTYAGFDELWQGFESGVGPAGVYCTRLPATSAAAVRDELFRRLGSPRGSFTLTAIARCASGRTPPSSGRWVPAAPTAPAGHRRRTTSGLV